MKNKVRFCWICGRKLYGNHFRKIKLPDDTERVCHKSCADKYINEEVCK